MGQAMTYGGGEQGDMVFQAMNTAGLGSQKKERARPVQGTTDGWSGWSLKAGNAEMRMDEP